MTSLRLRPTPTVSVRGRGALAALLAVVVSCAVLPLAAQAAPTPDVAHGASSVAGSWFGVLQPRVETAGALKPSGVGRGTLEIGWDNYEPGNGSFNPYYLAEIRAKYAALRSAGLDVVLDAGLQYAPAWVFGLAGGTRFVNQYGDVWQGSIGTDVPDAVFNKNVRAAEAAYLTRLAADLRDLPFVAIRVGGMYAGELHYPVSGYAGHQNSFWAFSDGARAASPVPGYQPGTGDQVTSTRFLNWYLSSLSGYGRWLATRYRNAFGPLPRLQVLEPSWGVRPGEVQAAGQGLLSGRSRAELTGALNEGLDWARQVHWMAAMGGTEAYSTWLDAGDQGPDSTYESPVRFLARLARPLGLPVAGENTGGNDRAAMALCVKRVADLGLTGMMWMREPELSDGVHASLADYAALIPG